MESTTKNRSSAESSRRFCVNCIHYKRVASLELNRCTRDARVTIDLVTGEENVSKVYNADDERSVNGSLKCGPEGRFFTLKPSEPKRQTFWQKLFQKLS